MTPTLEDHRKAFTEVSFLLHIFAATVDDLMGGATAPVGRIAGRRAGRKLPLHLPEPTLESVLAALADHFRNGFELAARSNAAGADVQIGRCVIRDVCADRGIAPGGALCKLFHAQLDGVVDELLARPVKSEIRAAGASCEIRTELR